MLPEATGETDMPVGDSPDGEDDSASLFIVREVLEKCGGAVV